MMNPFTWICDLFRAGNKPEPYEPLPPISPYRAPDAVHYMPDQYAGDAVTAQQDEKASLYQDAVIGQQKSVMDNWAPSERHLAQKKPRKRQPIAARKALKAVKAKKKAKRK